MTEEELFLSRLDYDAESGIVRHKKNDKVAGATNQYGYVFIRLKYKNKTYAKMRSHIAFLHMNGRFPSQEIDHKNGIVDDDRYENLREATRQDQVRNRKRYNKENLPRGVQRHGKKYRARMTVDHKQIELGSFDTVEEAEKAYNDAAEKIHADFYCDRK